MARALSGWTLTLLGLVALLAARAGAAPSPGQYDVGVTTLTFTKTSVTTGEPRVLKTVIWYPAMPGTGTAEALGRRDADVVRRRFPWIVFSHGACGRPTEASYLTMALASRGFVVAAPPHVGNTADDENCVGDFADSAANRGPDVRFVVDSMLGQTADPTSRFADRLRPESVGIAGLSFGGYTTLLTAQLDARLKAALSMVPGGVEFLGPSDITIPTMVIGGENDIIVGFEESELAYQRLAGPRFLVELLAANHLAVTDSCFPLCIPGEIPQERAHDLILHYALPFFRYYLAQGRSGVPGLIRPAPRTMLQADPLPRPTLTPTPLY